MGKIAIVTDSNSGITQDSGKRTWNQRNSNAFLY